MTRTRLDNQDRNRLFEVLANKGISITELALHTNVSPRTVRNWRSGKYTIPRANLEKLLAIGQIDLHSLRIESLEEWWNNSGAGKKGAFVRMTKYGPPGTATSRQLGGLRSYAKRKDRTQDIFTPVKIREPARSDDLAELMGILVGDGGITDYQVTISTNTIDDKAYIPYVSALVFQLFEVAPRVARKKGSQCTTIVASSVNMVRYLMMLGLHNGNKLRQGLDIPAWVLENPSYARACIRGIFDTDGCVFGERHNLGGKEYVYPRLAFVSASPQLRASIYQMLIDLELSPRIRGGRSVNLEKRSDIAEYFRLVGTKNPKHVQRWRKLGGVG